MSSFLNYIKLCGSEQNITFSESSDIRKEEDDDVLLEIGSKRIGDTFQKKFQL
jgi:hypothetical protein